MNTREKLKKISILKIVVISIRAIKNNYSLTKKIQLLFAFYKSYSSYKKLDKNSNFLIETKDLYPRIYDRTSYTPLDPIYFLQNNWCAKKIFQNKPIEHFDVGSDAKFLGTISQFTPTTMIDIRPLTIKQEGLNFIKGSILSLPFSDKEIHSLSSLCVIEHIGLGRYGDELDQFGSEKSAQELKRVLANNGDLYITVPIDQNNITYFNAHRAFTREYVLEIFKELELIEEKYIYGNEISNIYIPAKGFGTGLFHFRKL